MERIKSLKPFAVCYGLLIAVFFFGMVLVYCIPTSWIQGNVDASLAVMEGEGDYPMYFFYRHNSIMDVHTETVMYESMIPNLEKHADYNLVQRAMSMGSYVRYWHGYQLLLRPLSVVFQIQEVRYLGMLAFHLLLFWSAYLIAGRTRPWVAVLYVLSIVTGNIALSSVCLQFQTTFLVLFGSLGILLGRYERLKEKPMGLLTALFATGMVENFFDFLTFPIITLGIPLVILLWIRTRDARSGGRDNLIFTIQASVSWGMGYALSWITKWILAAAFLGVRYIGQTLSIAQYRLTGSEEEPVDRIGTLQKNLKAWMNIQDNGHISWSKVVILIAVVALILIVLKKVKELSRVSAYLPMLLVALYPYIWYLVMANHSQIHYWYTYRSQLVTLFALLVWIGSILREKGGQRRS